MTSLLLRPAAPVAPATECPRCGDSGEVQASGSEHLHAHDPALQLVECPDCGGGA